MSMTVEQNAVAVPATEAMDAAPLGWLLAKLQQALEELMADEAVKPLQKANAVARLGNLYLKTYRASELQRENKALARRVSELEECLADADALGVEAPLVPAPAVRQAATEGRVAEGRRSSSLGIATDAPGAGRTRPIASAGVGLSAATLESD